MPQACGAQAAAVFGDAAIGIASAVMTLLVLVLSEIIPKTTGRKLLASVGTSGNDLLIDFGEGT